MAVKDKRRGGTWSIFHFLVRVLGLTGLVAAGVGFLLASQSFQRSDIDLSSTASARTSLEAIRARLHVSPDAPLQQQAMELLRAGGDRVLQVAVYLLLAGIGAALFALIIEALSAIRQLFGRRGVFGTNVAVQVAIAAALLIGVNLYSFRHYLRFDWTRDQEFTLPADLRTQLAQLSQDEGQTTIVIYQKHNTFGQLAEKRNAYDYAAERTVVDKVKDLVDQFREFGPQFRVVVLDEEKEDFDDTLKSLTKDARPLREAIQRAPVNTIFFYTPGHVQQLTFNDFYQLDKTRSEDEGNLVLVPQGKEAFARKVLNVGEKRPRIAVAIFDKDFGTEGHPYYGLGGMKKMLTAHGFDTREIIFKRIVQRQPGDPRPPIEPAVYSLEESRYDSLERRIPGLEADIKRLETQVATLSRLYDGIKSGQLDALTEVIARENLPVLLLQDRTMTLEKLRPQVQNALKQLPKDKRDEVRDNQLEEIGLSLTRLTSDLERRQQERDDARQEKANLRVESAVEMRRMTDLKAKMQRLLADCDLLLIPRLTIHDIQRGEVLTDSAQIHRMTDDQVAAIKDFLKAGKPVLAGFGPPDEGSMGDPAGSADNLENLLGELGIKFGKQTVLYLSERDALKERNVELQGQSPRRRSAFGADVEIPPVDFARDFRGGDTSVKADKPNPIRESLRLTARSLGKNQALNLRIQHPQPVYYDSAAGSSRLKFEPVFMMTDAASWNEDRPMPSADNLPSPPDSAEPSRPTPFGTMRNAAKKTYGPFPIGVAIETKVPASWYTESKEKPATVRVAAIGSGSLFVTQRETPATDKMLLDTCNWLLGRDDEVAQSTKQWSYPRVELNEREQALWHWGTRLGLPGAFAYLGLVVLMVRRLR